MTALPTVGRVVHKARRDASALCQATAASTFYALRAGTPALPAVGRVM